VNGQSGGGKLSGSGRGRHAGQSKSK